MPNMSKKKKMPSFMTVRKSKPGMVRNSQTAHGSVFRQSSLLRQRVRALTGKKVMAKPIPMTVRPRMGSPVSSGAGKMKAIPRPMKKMQKLKLKKR